MKDLRGDPERHLSSEELEAGLERLWMPSDAGSVELVVVRAEDGRETPERSMATEREGIPGDAWERGPASPDDQISLMRVDVATLFANGRPLSLFGDNLLVSLDLSSSNLPAGSRLAAGEAVLEVTGKPHTGCAKLAQRFGVDAVRTMADPRWRDQRLRGLYAKVVLAGEIGRGDAIRVLSRSRLIR